MYAKSKFTLIKRKMADGKTVYYYTFYDEDGIRRYRSTGERSKAKATEVVLDLIEKGTFGKSGSTHMSFADYTRDFFIPGRCPIEADLRRRGRSISQATMYNRRKAMEKHILPYLGRRPLCSISTAVVNRWLLELPEKGGLSRNSSNQVFAILSVMMGHMAEAGDITANPCAKVRRLGDDSERYPAFTIAEVRKVIGSEGEWDDAVRLMCIVAASTGMRLGEVQALLPENVHEDRIEVRYNWARNMELKTPKNGRGRTVPISPDLYRMLREAAAGNDGFIFSFDGKKPFSFSHVGETLRARCDAVGVKGGKTFHSFRAFMNTQLSEANVNETVIRSIVGHSDAKMTEHYLHLESGEFRGVRDVQDSILKEIG
jgi:integrase